MDHVGLEVNGPEGNLAYWEKLGFEDLPLSWTLGKLGLKSTGSLVSAPAKVAEVATGSGEVSSKRFSLLREGSP